MKEEEYKYTNRLAKEKSPYLLQHAHNPVDWYPWGDEAFEKAKKENKLIFLSVGYATCHWCHVMEHESFENEKIAEVMNSLYVNVKVDREERPDVDRVYMTYVQNLTGGGGWPMSVFLTPDLKPIFGGTYFPPKDSVQGFRSRPGFTSIMQAIHNQWKNREEEVRIQSDNILLQLEKVAASTGNNRMMDQDEENYLQSKAKKLYTDLYEHYLSEYDQQYGGYGDAPKFPRPSIMNFLFRAAKKDLLKESKPIVDSALYTLQRIATGGLYDQVGYGFHRYSVDGQWRVPHFEKMLYDQAQLIRSFCDAYSITKDPFFKKIIDQTITYCSRDMLDGTSKAFYSAEDADSLPGLDAKEKKKEGAFYVFGWEELKTIFEDLEPETFSLFAKVYCCTPEGNIIPELDPHKEMEHKNHFRRIRGVTDDQLFHEIKDHIPDDLDQDDVYDMLAIARTKLFNYRNENRARPYLDDKILTSWNGLMIGALAHAGIVCKDSSYINLAKDCAQFVKDKMYNSSIRQLMHSARHNEVSSIKGFLNDYAFVVDGLLNLFEATGEIEWVKFAKTLTDIQLELFFDEEHGGFFETTGADESILIRAKEHYDGAEPAGNSVSALNLLRLSDILKDSHYREYAAQTLVASPYLEKAPQAVPQLCCALDYLISSPPQIIIVTENDDTFFKVRDVLLENYLPNRVFVRYHRYLRDTTPKSIYLGIEQKHDDFSIYICKDNTCSLPTNDLNKVLQLLN
eukprot:CAMPEP_0117425126 /NCGR_PEP_ID=MMETSP0758-20121206/5436_1 /TAXON_ID=63605 /ORGANISM="Percolomonas cosmopolitus, Strain AE-1 (ATCC 50343)" /LENGTH=737 /DNA_ID=CAMNT_0005209375 /DNA_START=145 /DNA_END=2358 /DNA_ORIENTATION=-